MQAWADYCCDKKLDNVVALRRASDWYQQGDVPIK